MKEWYNNKVVGYRITTTHSVSGGSDINFYTTGKQYGEDDPPEFRVWIDDLTEIINTLVDIIKTECPNDIDVWPKDSRDSITLTYLLAK